MLPDKDFMRFGLIALGYTVAATDSGRWAGCKEDALAPEPRFVVIGSHGGLTLTIGCNVRRATMTERFRLKRAGELIYYNGIRSREPVWQP